MALAIFGGKNRFLSYPFSLCFELWTWDETRSFFKFFIFFSRTNTLSDALNNCLKRRKKICVTSWPFCSFKHNVSMNHQSYVGFISTLAVFFFDVAQAVLSEVLLTLPR